MAPISHGNQDNAYIHMNGSIQQQNTNSGGKTTDPWLETGCPAQQDLTGSGSPDIELAGAPGGSQDEEQNHKKQRCCKHGPRAWCKKYWWEGQELQKPKTESMKKLLAGKPWNKRIMIKYRRVIGFCIPAILYHFFWWGYFIQFNMWHLFTEKYTMTITMIVGSMIAGMTSEGGGAVAFPVMTLALGVSPAVARDFAVMIQSAGMTCAAFTIFFMRVRVEWHSLIFCSIGGTGGIIFGLHIVDPALSPSVKKLGFVSIWFAFASVLVFLNRVAKRRTFSSIPDFNWWRMLVLVIFGFLGGVFTSFSGSGLDICSFMVLTLFFRISEKTATPTSVILMAFNSLVGFYWRGVMLDAVSTEAWEYFAVCVPIVVIGAPVGSVLGSHFHRIILASLVIILDTVALISAFAIIRPLTGPLVGGCVAVIVGCFAIFMGFTFAGQKLLDKYEAREKGRQEIQVDENIDHVEEILDEKPTDDTTRVGDVGHHDSKPNAYVNTVFTVDESDCRYEPNTEPTRL